MDDKKRREVEKKRTSPCVLTRRTEVAEAKARGMTLSRITAPLGITDVEDHIVELLNLDAAPDMIAGCRRRLRRDF